MGKRKKSSRKPQGPKKVCGQRFQTGINYLSAAVDVYSDWVDACDAVAKNAASRHEDNDVRGMQSRGSPGSPDQPVTSGDRIEDSYADDY
ncbi:hypothetical protein VTN00DRAFT_968 [Thermoascus crustaceus]|uniref:uncharacterized protein n=1 Tax=Thermoascus crustaceus TaxID=5088 RepID=UPI003743EC5F